MADISRKIDAGVPIAFMRGYRTTERSLAALLDSSGGNALVAALAMCDSVNVYAYGLLSSNGRPTGDKLYAHFFDTEVGLCLPVDRLERASGYIRYFASRIMSQCAASRSIERARSSSSRHLSGSKYCRVFRAWRKDRLRAEVLLHALHALGVVTWRQ